MSYALPAEHKVEVHRKILKDASRRVRAEGIAGAAVSSVMRDAGLTHGGFYKHFGSKDEPLTESLSEAFQEVADRLTQAAEKSQPETAWKAIVKARLSPEHCDPAECMPESQPPCSAKPKNVPVHPLAKPDRRQGSFFRRVSHVLLLAS
jgi:AcrR family transcriptional regulator